MEENTKKEIIKDIEEINSTDTAEILKKRKARLKTLVSYAKTNSDFFKDLYKNIDVENFELSDLPITEKSTLMTNFNRYICDKNIKKEDVEHYLSDFNLMLEPFMGKYRVMMTSGTTGTPLLMIRDEMHETVHATLMNKRLFKDMDTSIMNPKVSKLAAIIAAKQPTSSYISFLKMQKANKDYQNNMLCLSTLSPIKELIEKLNEFMPDFIGGYPSTLSLLANEQLEGRLNISPKAIACSAEMLTESIIIIMKKAWGKGLRILNNYCTTEGGEIAMSCMENKLHVNYDWVILEPLDENDNPVKDGETSKSVLVTDLSNFVQPIIRYRLNDRIKVIPNKCKCGSKLPIIEIEGRTGDTLKINSVQIPSVTLTLLMEDLPKVLSYQYAQISPVKIVLRTVYAQDTDKDDFNRQITARMNKLKETYECKEMEFEIKEEQPKNNQRGGKLKLVVNEYNQQ